MRVCLEPLWHVPVSSSRGPIGGGGQRRLPRQDVPGKESPNRHSKVRLVIVVSHLLNVEPLSRPECFALVLLRVRPSTPATPAATPCPVMPPAATATSAGSTEELGESEEAGVAWATRPNLTPTFSTRGGRTTAVSTPRPTTAIPAMELCPTARPTSPCTASPPTVACRSCRSDGAAAVERQGDESLRPSFRLQPIRIKGTGRGRSLLLAPVPIKWMLSNLGKRPAH